MRYPAMRPVLWVKWISEPPFQPVTAWTARQKAGIKYEKRIQERLLDHYGPDKFFPSQWFSFSCGDRVQYAQPDGLLLLEERKLLVLEIKYSHTPGAYWQLLNCYLPVLKVFFRGNIELIPVEICKWYDPATVFPSAVRMVEGLESARSSSFNVHILNRW